MRQLFLLVMFWGSMPLILLDPFLGVIYYTLNNIIRPEQLMWGDPGAVGRIFLAVQALSFISWLKNKDKLTPEYTPLPLQMKLLWVIAAEMTLVTYTVAYDQAYSWQWTLGFWKMTIFCFVMTKSINTAKKLQFYYVVSIVWWTLLEIWGIQQKLGGNERMEGLGGSAMPDINGLAAVVVMYLPMVYYSLFSRNKFIRFFIGIPAIIISVVFIIFSDSRGAFLGMAVCMIIIFLRSKGTQKIKTLIALGLLAGVFYQFAPPEYFERLATITGEENVDTGETEYEGSAAGRTAMWKGAWHIYKNHPEYWLLGVGIKCYPLMYYQRHSDELYAYLTAEEFILVQFGGAGGKDIHNTFLNFLTGGGVITFLTWMFLLFYAWYQAHTVPRKYPQIVDGVDIHNYARALEVGIIGYCVCIMFISALTDFFYWYLLMSGIVTNLGKAELKRQELDLEEEFVSIPERKPLYAY